MKPLTKNQSGIARILFFFSLLFIFPFERVSSFSSNPDWLQCINPDVQWLTLSLNSVQSNVVSIFLKGALLFAGIGIFTRASYWISFLSISVLMMNWNQFCYTTHELTPLPIALLLWALLDTGSGYRLSSMIFRKGNPEAHTSNNWLIPFQRVHFCIIFFSAGYTKLMSSGIEWVKDPSPKNILTLQNYLFEGAWQSPLFPAVNLWLINHPTLCVLLGALVLAFEILSPLALLNKWLTLILVPGLALVQVGILIVIYINFVTWIPLYLFWLPYKLIKPYPKRNFSVKKNGF